MFNLCDNFYLNEKGEVDPIFNYLGCLSKIEFYYLKAKKHAYFNYFCNDISFIFEENDKGISIYSNTLSNNINAFEYTTSECSSDEIVKYIDQSLNNDGFALVSTKFDEIPAYLWYKEDSYVGADGHIVFINHQDDNYYYFVDSDRILSPKRNLKYPYNKQINMMPKKHLLNACQKKAIYYKVTFNESNIIDNVNLKYKLQMIIKNFREPSSLNFRGRYAYEHFLLSLKNNSVKFMITLNHLEWNFQIIAGRRYILMKCLENSNISSYQLTALLESLTKSNNIWEQIKMLIIKHSTKEISDLQARLYNLVKQAYDTDNLIIKELEVLLSDDGNWGST